MKNLTKSGMLSALAIAALLVPSCKKDAKTNDIVNQPTQQTQTGRPQKDQSENWHLIAYWPMDGNGTDLSGNGHTATITGAVTGTADRFGNANHALHFNNNPTTGAYMTVPDAPDLRLSGIDCTINAWVKLNTYNPGNYSQILSKRINTVNSGWSWGISGTTGPGGAGSIIFDSDSFGAGYGISTTTISSGDWHMVTTIYRASTHQVDMFIDGHYTNTTSNVLPPNGSITAALTIGADGAIGGYYFDGDIDDVRIYTGQLTALQITGLYTWIPDPNSLIAYWSFDGNVRDFSGNGHDGTANSVTPAIDRDGPTGAYAFNGTSSYVSVPDNVALRLNNTDFTLNAWVKIASPGGALQILAKRSATAEGYGWSITTAGTTFFGPGGGMTSSLGTTVLTTNTWHMVTVTYKATSPTAGTLTQYVDDMVTGTPIANFPTPGASVTNPLFIGRDDLAAQYYFNGAIDDVRIYNRTISFDDLRILYGTRY